MSFGERNLTLGNFDSKLTKFKYSHFLTKDKSCLNWSAVVAKLIKHQKYQIKKFTVSEGKYAFAVWETRLAAPLNYQIS